MKSYTDEQLLGRVAALEGFKGYPTRYWIIGARSIADAYNTYDDKFYIFKGTKFILMMTGTTNTGGYGLKNFVKWNKKGAAVVKADEWYYDVWQVGKHKGKVEALKQVKPFKIYRDGNGDNKVDTDTKWSWEDWIGINFHPNTYDLNYSGKVKQAINGWSTGCQTINDIPKYKQFIELLKEDSQKRVSYVLINEF